jgi:hypothetical protein
VFVEVVAEDYDNLDAVYSANDTISLKFDRPTNKGGGETSGGTEYVDSLLNFSTPLGNAYSGRWNEDGTAFDITIDDAGNGSVVLLSQVMYDENNTVVVPPTFVTLVAEVRTALGNSQPITANRSLPLSGNVGENSTDAFPRVKSVLGRERRKNLEWEIVIGLDRASDRGATRLPPQCDSTGVLSYPCMLGSPYSLFSVTPDDAFSGPGKTATGKKKGGVKIQLGGEYDGEGRGGREVGSAEGGRNSRACPDEHLHVKRHPPTLQTMTRTTRRREATRATSRAASRRRASAAGATARRPHRRRPQPQPMRRPARRRSSRGRGTRRRSPSCECNFCLRN